MEHLYVDWPLKSGFICLVMRRHLVSKSTVRLKGIELK